MEQIAYLKSHKYYRKYNNQVLDLLKVDGIEYSLVSTRYGKKVLGKRLLVKREDLSRAAKLVLSVPMFWLTK
jgi:hypothetical protein